MRTPMSEQETIIRWYREDEEATIYTSDYTMMTRFDKFVETGNLTPKTIPVRTS